MKNAFPLLLLVTFLGCNNTVAKKEAASKNSSPTQNESAANDAAKSATSIKIFKNDKLVFEYKAMFAEGGITTYKSGEKDMVLKLSNDDNT